MFQKPISMATRCAVVAMAMITLSACTAAEWTSIYRSHDFTKKEPGGARAPAPLFCRLLSWFSRCPLGFVFTDFSHAGYDRARRLE